MPHRTPFNQLLKNNEVWVQTEPALDPVRHVIKAMQRRRKHITPFEDDFQEANFIVRMNRDQGRQAVDDFCNRVVQDERPLNRPERKLLDSALFNNNDDRIKASRRAFFDRVCLGIISLSSAVIASQLKLTETYTIPSAPDRALPPKNPRRAELLGAPPAEEPKKGTTYTTLNSKTGLAYIGMTKAIGVQAVRAITSTRKRDRIYRKAAENLVETIENLMKEETQRGR